MSKVYFFFMSGAKKGRIESAPLDVGGAVRIGRQHDCELQLDPYEDIPASGYHALVTRESEELFAVEDSNSSWGTWKNDQRLTGRVPITTGDVITCGLDEQGRQGPRIKFYLEKDVMRCPACEGPVYKRHFKCPQCARKYCLRCIDFTSKVCRPCGQAKPAAAKVGKPPGQTDPGYDVVDDDDEVDAKKPARVIVSGRDAARVRKAQEASRAQKRPAAAAPVVGDDGVVAEPVDLEAPFCAVCCDFAEGPVFTCPACRQTVCTSHKRGAVCPPCAGVPVTGPPPEKASEPELVVPELPDEPPAPARPVGRPAPARRPTPRPTAPPARPAPGSAPHARPAPGSAPHARPTPGSAPPARPTPGSAPPARTAPGPARAPLAPEDLAIPELDDIPTNPGRRPGAPASATGRVDPAPPPRPGPPARPAAPPTGPARDDEGVIVARPDPTPSDAPPPLWAEPLAAKPDPALSSSKIHARRPATIPCERCQAPLTASTFFVCERCRLRLCGQHKGPRPGLCDACARAAVAPSPAAPARPAAPTTPVAGARPASPTPPARPGVPATTYLGKAPAGPPPGPSGPRPGAPPARPAPPGWSAGPPVPGPGRRPPEDLIETTTDDDPPTVQDDAPLGLSGQRSALPPLSMSGVRFECPYCDRPLPADARRCTHCNREL